MKVDSQDFSFPVDPGLVIIIPVFNDWEVAECCLEQIDAQFADSGIKPVVLLVNDGSSTSVPDNFMAAAPPAAMRIKLLDLSRNLGHQRAICIAMVHVYENFPGAAVLVMDGDGEDPPEAIPLLLAAYFGAGQERAVFAARRRRVEGLTFKLFYMIYRLFHYFLVGFDIRMGNFSILPPSLVARLVRSSELWNHYAASLIKTRLPYDTIPIDRGKRIKGQSRMNFVGLVLHGLSAMSVYSDTIGVRILMASSVLMLAGLFSLAGVVAIRFCTDWAIPGWATNLFMLTTLLIFQIFIVCLLFVFGMLAGRSGPSFIPLRDCPYFALRAQFLEFPKAKSPAIRLISPLL